MKKIFAAALSLVIATIVFVSCEKDTADTFKTTTVACTDSAWLWADSLSCTGKNFFQIIGSNKLIAVAPGFVDIDTVVNNAVFYITYDSIAGTTPCHGAIFQNATLSCHQRK